MPFTPPQFNVPSDVWYCGNTPADGVPDVENVSVQLYINPRAPFSIDETILLTFETPAIYVRMPRDTLSIWQQLHIVEIPAESGRYYVARWKEIMHLGFPNEYLVVSVHQCDGSGVPILRDICGPPAPVGAMQVHVSAVMAGLGHKGDPSAHTGEGAMGFDIAVGLAGNGVHA